MRIAIPVLLCVICLSPANAQDSVDHKPKALLRALKRSGITDISLMKELALYDSAGISESTDNKFYQISSNDLQPNMYVYVGRVNSCRAGGCSIEGALSSDDSSEYFDYFVLFNADKEVQLVKVFNYQATHGQEISSKGWLKQFVGHSGQKPLQVDKNIDAISGATISVYAITSDVEMKTRMLREAQLIVKR